MSINHIYRPVDPSLLLYIDGQGSRRLDTKVTNLAINPEYRHYPCLKFDGVDDYVDCGNPSNLNLSNFSIRAWIMPTLRTSLQQIVSKIADGSHGESQRQWGLRLYTDNKPEFVWYGELDANAYRGTLGSTPIVSGLHRIVATYDSTQNVDSRVKLYVDGKPEQTSIDISTGSPISIPVGSAHIGIGHSLSSTGQPGTNTTSFFHGLIKDVEIDNYTLSAIDVLADYNTGIVGTTNVAGQWRFNEGSGATAIDSSGNGNNGTICGATRQDGKANGTLVGGVSYKNSPIGKSVINFDGTTSYVKHPIANNYSSNFSCFVWAKAPFQSYLIGRYDTGLSARSWLIGTDQANEKRMRVILSDDGTAAAGHSKDYLTTANVFDDKWHLYGFSWDAGTLRLYVDGIPQAVTKTYDASFTSIFNSSSDIIVGARIVSNVPTGFFTGQIGEYYVFKRSVSPSESSILYNSTRQNYGR